MPAKSKKYTSRRSRRGRRMTQRAGGLGQSYTFGAPIVPGLGNSAEVVPMSSCLATSRFGEVSPPTSGLGLPGLSRGGGRKARRGRSRRVQRGGRYTMDLTPLTGAAPWAGGIPQATRIPCEGGYVNPLNPGPHTGSSQPPIQRGGVGGIDSQYYYAPTAGYGNQPSSWVGGTGAPVLVQTPYDARSMNMACLKTGGGRRGRRGARATRGTRRH